MMDNQTTLLNYSLDFNPDNCSKSATGFVACSAGQFLHYYVLPLILAAGFFGNTLSFVIMVNSVNRRVTCCLFFAALAFSDNLALFSCTIQKITESIGVTKESPEVYSVNLCDVYGYLLSLSAGCSSYLITCITYQRFTAVCKIMTRHSKITKKRAGWIISIVVLISAFFHIPSIFTSTVQNSTECAAYSSHIDILHIWVGMNMIIFFVIPVSLISYWNVRIFLEVYQRPLQPASSSYQMTETSTSARDNVNVSSIGKPRHIRDADRKLTKMMILISLAYVCLSLPQHCRYIYQINVDPNDNISQARLFLFYHISNKLFIANHAFNFYLYCLSGARFRNDFVQLIKIPFNWIKQKFHEV